MKKLIIIMCLLFLLVMISIIGTVLVTKGEEIKPNQDILIYQYNIDKQIEIYGYTIDKPNIILNPYKVSPLTALITFETEDYKEIKVSIVNKNNEIEYLYTSLSDIRHYLPIYKLYPNYENKIILEYDNIRKEIIVKTNKLPDDLNVLEYYEVSNDLYFETNSNYLYAYDNNKDIRWYYNDYILGNITKINNNHFLISNNQKISDTSTTGIVEIDLLGKIYYEYLLEDNYNGLNTYKNNNLLVSSNKIIEIDRQNGNIINNDVSMTINSNSDIKLDTTNSYKKYQAIRFGNLNKTETSNVNIAILNYNELDKKYKLKYLREYNRLIIKGNFSKEDKVYVILDKMLDKKIYKMNNNYLCINNVGLKSEYSIYIKINNKLYKTNKYVKF